MELWIAIGAVALVLVCVFLLATRSSIKKLNGRAEEAWRGITSEMGQRAELLPKIVETVQPYASHERGVFEEVEQARAETLRAADPAEASRAENRMQGALRSLFALAEAYPELQTSPEFLQMQSELVASEDRIQSSRRFYNGGVRELNTRIKVFPGPLVARGMGCQQRAFFEVADRAAISEPPRVQF